MDQDGPRWTREQVEANTVLKCQYVYGVQANWVINHLRIISSFIRLQKIVKYTKPILIWGMNTSLVPDRFQNVQTNY